MKIRAFEIEDQNAVIELWKACGLVVPWNDPVKDIARKLNVDADLFLVGESNREIVASVMGRAVDANHLAHGSEFAVEVIHTPRMINQ